MYTGFQCLKGSIIQVLPTDTISRLDAVLLTSNIQELLTFSINKKS